MFPGAVAAALAAGQWQTHYLRPNETLTSSTWNYAGAGVTAHHEALDEVTADDATTYSQVSVGVKSVQSNPLTIGFSNPTNAVVTDQPVVVSARFQVQAAAGNDNNVKWDFRLLELGVERDSWFHNQVDGSGWYTYQKTLSSAVKSSINNWDNVRLEVRCTWTTGSAFEVTCDITWMEVLLHE